LGDLKKLTGNRRYVFPGPRGAAAPQAEDSGDGAHHRTTKPSKLAKLKLRAITKFPGTWRTISDIPAVDRAGKIRIDHNGSPCDPCAAEIPSRPIQRGPPSMKRFARK
jgi:diadenosine tetraphosphatase ApaH/serine/threonine PP2A family protein phosphatase